MTHAKLFPLIAAVPAIAFALSACAGSSDDQSADSPDSAGSVAGEPVVVYSGRSEEVIEPLFEKFTEETGVPVEVRYGDTAEMAAQIIEEGDATPADVYYGQDAGALGALDGAGMCAPLADSIANLVPATYRSTDGTWTGVTGRARVIAYDSTQLPADQVPTSVFDLTDEQWRGQVAIAPTNGSFQAFVTAMRVAAGEDATREWLQGLVDNDVQLYEKNGLIRDAVDAGEVQLGLINHYYWYTKAAEVGENAMNVQLAFAEPGDPGALVNLSGACIVRPTDNADGARALMEWLLSESAQRWFVETTFEYPLVAGVEGPDGVPPLAQVKGPDIPLAELDDLPGTLLMLQDVGLT